MKWQLISDKIPSSLKELKALLLQTRDIKDSADFFNIKSPFDLSLAELEIDKKQVQKAIQLILKAKEEQTNILIFGDYDADGITATAIMWQILHDLGCRVTPFIPHREKHGYGLSQKAIDEILAEENKATCAGRPACAGRPNLIITVDNGIVAHEQVQRLVDEGIQVIVTDHHQLEDKLPNANAIVQTTKLCGATVAWVLCRELLNTGSYRARRQAGHPAITGFQDDSLLKDQLDLCGIATIADQVKLQEANRIFAAFGIKALRKTKRLGLLALFKEAQIEQKTIDSYHINYLIAPRINAMGRLEHGLDALRLLSTSSREKSENLAKKLGEINGKRQDITQQALETARSEFATWKNENLIIVSSEDYHEGVIGLIAGKLVDEFYKPAIAISLGEKTAKASARSISGFNITDLLRQIKDDLLSVGGHPMAAGFSLEINNLELVISKLQAKAKKQLDKSLLERSLKIELELPANLLNEDTIELVDEFAPFGPGNRKPIFILKNLQIIDFKTMGRENNHLLINVKAQIPNLAYRQAGDKYLKCIAWRMGEKINELNPGDSIDIAGMLEINEWNGRHSIQVVVRDFRVCR